MAQTRSQFELKMCESEKGDNPNTLNCIIILGVWTPVFGGSAFYKVVYNW